MLRSLPLSVRLPCGQARKRYRLSLTTSRFAEGVGEVEQASSCPAASVGRQGQLFFFATGTARSRTNTCLDSGIGQGTSLVCVA